MRLLIIGSIAFLLGACTMHSDELSTDDAYRHYVAPAICKKQSDCVGSGLFATVYPGGIDECVNKIINGANVSNQLSGCTDAEYKTCIADFSSAMCPADPKAAGIPPKPSSCSSCAF